VPVTASRKNTGLLWLPTESVDAEYTVPSGTDPLCMVIMVTGVSQMSFAYKFHMIFEVVGAIADSTTPTYGDPEGFTAVLEVAESVESAWVGAVSVAGKTLIKAASLEVARMSGVLVGRIGAAAGAIANSYLQSILDWRRGGARGEGNPGPFAMAAFEKRRGESQPTEFTLAEVEKFFATGEWKVIIKEPYPVVLAGAGTKGEHMLELWYGDRRRRLDGIVQVFEVDPSVHKQALKR